MRRGRRLGARSEAVRAQDVRGYRSDLDQYACAVFGDTPLDRVRRSTIQQLVDEVAALHSGQKARNVATAIMALYRYWLGRFDDLTDPTVGLDLPAGSAPRERIVTPDELMALLDAIDEGDRAPFALAGMAGLRHGEIKALRVRDVVLGEADARDQLACGSRFAADGTRSKGAASRSRAEVRGTCRSSRHSPRSSKHS